MCLGVPGRLVQWIEQEGIFARALLDFGGIQRECQMACVPDAKIGDFVIVHAGIAISKVDTSQAEQTRQEWEAMMADHAAHADGADA